MNKPIIDWNEANVETLKRLWKEGESAAYIASILGTEKGRLAVIGKATRLKLGPHPSGKSSIKAAQVIHHRLAKKKDQADGSISRAKAVGPVRKKKPPKPEIVIDKVVERRASIDGPVMAGDFRFLKSEAWKPLPGSEPVTLEALKRHQCCWPLGDGPFLFCALPTNDGARYCASHTYLSHPRT